MLNQLDDRRIDRDSDWCVGEPAGRWDVSFGARIAEKLRRMLGLTVTIQPRQQGMPAARREAMRVRKAA